ncbi:hypothetical protein [Bifidobacterium tsurumiense]|uniref:Putative lipoprotein n=1 Tax=Bifidobacterium tsurumiense TaxID=356829 RepID=A0A087EKF8_9BIFI|nr:hypothetical protein [Bifidobacterium tsurumiense]KFJ08259.1 putative lipoprotein [Bifidobacterium tsurumiense]MDY4677323.1 hypothetical protein [Bifidobacterium tsurumiense]MSS13205.1 hypothetical protein [Bifidobacterium tsurumiense]
MKNQAAKMIAAIMSVGLLIGVAACEGQVPKPTSSTSAQESPDLTQDQEKAIRQQILSVINAANEAKSADGLDVRMTGPALEIRTSELAIAQATGSLDAKTTIPEDITQTVIPTDSGWPRSVFTITTTTEDQQSKRLLVMNQDSARSNYKLWAIARLFQGAKLPKFAVPDHGSQMGTADDTGLVVTPQQAVEQYADLLQNGSSSQYASNFADDYFRQELTTLTQTVQEGMERNNGTQQQTFSAVKDQIAVMRSSDGGDLVVAQINSEWTRQAGEGRESQPASDAERALFGDGTATSTMKVTYVNVIALYVPPADSGQQITAVGAERQPVKVEAI